MIEDRIVAITGASSGIGEATALACAGKGAKVALGGLHGLVSNAGLMLLGPVEGADTDQRRRSAAPSSTRTSA